MRDPKRIEKTLAVLKDYWLAHSDLRLGQIIENARMASQDPDLYADLFYIEDDKLIDAISGLWLHDIKMQRRN